MSWIAWIAVIFGGLVALDVAFIAVVITIDFFNDWRYRHAKRRASCKAD